MKQIQIPTPMIALLAVSFLSAGCSKTSSSAPQPLDPAKLPAAVSQAFDQASGQTKEMANNYVSAFQGQDPAAAFLELQKLRAQQNLNSQQQSVLASAMMTTFQQLRISAANGNQSSQSVMHQYLSTR